LTEPGVWQTFVDNAKPGLLYSYRVNGPNDQAAGHRFDRTKFLIDPYARAITNDPGRAQPSKRQESSPIVRPSSGGRVPKCVVVDPTVDWGGDRRPLTPWADTVLYECHVRGMTKLHPEVPPNLRGTYLGLAHNSVIQHLQSLGVTALELLPVQQIASEPHLTRNRLTNYFGYSPVGLFAPHSGYATSNTGSQVDEFRQMVKRYHTAGIEIILDIVLNHTAEGGDDGPVYSLRGIDNATYYRLDKDDSRRYIDFTGCGSTGPKRCTSMASASTWQPASVVPATGFRLPHQSSKRFEEIQLYRD
jgi:glycogen operon protein